MALSVHRVGIVDDDLSVRRALSRLFRSSGITVEVFASAAEFLERPEEPALSCVLIDLFMPGMDGLDLLRSLSARGGTPPLIVVTANDDERVRETAIRSGAVAFLRKPFDEQELLRAVSTAVGG